MRILIADSLREAYQSLKVVLQAEPDITVVGFAPRPDEVLHQISYCDVLLLGESLTRRAGVGLIRQVVHEAPQVKVLITGLSEEAGDIIRYVEAGAAGYILKQETAAALLQKVRAAYRNRAVVSPHMAATLMAHLAALSMQNHAPRGMADRFSFEDLTPREQEVLDLLADDMSNRQIANRLHIQVGTVKNHVHHILKKLKVNDRYEAANVYARWRQHQGAHQAYVVL